MDNNFRYKTNNVSLHYVLRQFRSRRMEIDPQFKDLKHFSRQDRSLFIESLILGIPTQPIWCEESPSGDYIVLDGSERLITLLDFARGDFSLTHLKILKEYQNLHFDSLPYHEKIALEDRYQFTFIIINYDTPPQLKCEFIRRLLHDTGNGSNQSARNYAWPQSFSLLQEIRDDCDRLIEFGLRDARWSHSLLETPKRRTEIDEVLLSLLMIEAVLDGQTPERAYTDEHFSVSDLLDWTMSFYDRSQEKYFEIRHFILRTLTDIAAIYGTPAKIVLRKSFSHSGRDRKELSLPEFYVFFIRAHSARGGHPQNWRNSTFRLLPDMSPARKLISSIFEAKDV